MKHALLMFTCFIVVAIAGMIGMTPSADAQPSYWTAQNCNLCHYDDSVTCNGCHAHGVHTRIAGSDLNLTATTDKTTYSPGETISITVNGGNRHGWVRVILYDQDGTEVARSSGPGGTGGGDEFPVTLSGKAPSTAGTYTFKASWFGNEYDGPGAYYGPNWVSRGNGHGEEMISTNSFTVAAPQDTTAPSVTTFTIPSTSTSLTVSIESFTASDNVGVTGYLVTESSTEPAAGAAGWAATPQASYTFATAGSKTLYAWAKDAAGNVSSSMSDSVTITLVDTTAPSAPSGLTAVASGPTSVVLSWNASSDNVGVKDYLVYRNGSQIGLSVSTNYSDSTVLPSTTYDYNVAARDDASNVSVNSNTATVTTPPDGGGGEPSADNIGFFQNGQWYLDANGNMAWDGTGTDIIVHFGKEHDTPVTGDWNGDGATDIGYFRDGRWHLDLNGNFVWDGDGTDTEFDFGILGDVPVTGDWNGDGVTDIGVFRLGTWYLDSNGNMVLDNDGTDVVLDLGVRRGVPITGDWNGDGVTDIGVFWNGHWYLDVNGNMAWDGKGSDAALKFGRKGDIPVTGDWNGDGVTDIGVLRGDWLYLDANGSMSWERGVDMAVRFQLPGPTENTEEEDGAIIPLSGKW